MLFAWYVNVVFAVVVVVVFMLFCFALKPVVL